MDHINSEIELNNGYKLPRLGLGLWKSKGGEVEEAIKYAIDIGYRHFDGAFFYQNEKEVGRAIAEKISDGSVKREELFITSKLWNTFHNPNSVERACQITLNDLGMEYIDLYLMHFPLGYAEGDELLPMDANGEIRFSDFDYIDTWREMENLVKSGLVKSIGVSNFNHKQLKRLIDNSTIKPVVNQVECHPYLPQIKLGEWMSTQNIVLTSYSPLGSPDRPFRHEGDLNLLADERLLSLPKKYNKSVGQILLRYHLDRGFAVIPKSVKKSHLKENFDIFDFKLLPEDVELLNSFDCNRRYISLIGYGHTHKYYPFNEDF